jgi:hypothetical protein
MRRVLLLIGLVASSWSGFGADTIGELRKKAEAGDAAAQFGLGMFYDFGTGSVPKDSVEAVKWYRKAGEQGHAAAQFRLGSIYATGGAVQKDNAEAVKWYRKAAESYRKGAEQGDAQAQSTLGVMYSQGYGVPKDLVQAHVWLTIAATKADETAKKALTFIEPQMTPEQKADADQRARELIERLEKKN